MSNALRLQNVDKSYDTPQGPLQVLNGVTLLLERGQSIALKGDSGCGKSTLLHLAAGLDAIDNGEIWVESVQLSNLDDAGRAALRRDHIGLVFQQFNLIPSLRVADNIAFQARLSDRIDKAWIEVLTERLGLSELSRQIPRTTLRRSTTACRNRPGVGPQACTVACGRADRQSRRGGGGCGLNPDAGVVGGEQVARC